MEKITYDFEENINVFSISDYIEILQKKYLREFYINKNVSIVKGNVEKIYNIISVHNNIIELNFDNLSFNVDCEIKIKKNLSTKTISLFKEDEENIETLILYRNFEGNEDLALYDSMILNKTIPSFFQTIKINTACLKFEDFLIIDKNILNKCYHLLDYIPNKIINLCNENFTVKNYGNDILRYHFNLTDKDLNLYDNDFYNETKIRIKDINIFNYKEYVFCKTSSNNTIIFKKEKKTV